jgi:predicted phosphoribosyltransferase
MKIMRAGLLKSKSWFGSIFFLFALFAAPAVAITIDRIILATPIYKELWRENLGRLLASIATLHSVRDRRPAIALVFNINNLESADQDAVLENQETVAFLRRLAEGKRPIFRVEHRDLERGVRAILDTAVTIRILDRTRGIQERNIGRERDVLVQGILEGMTPAQLDSTVVGQMDGDSALPANWLSRVEQIFSDPEVDFAMTNLQFEVEPNASEPMWRRAIQTKLDMAYWGLLDAKRGALPRSSTPRIIARARTLKTLGIPAVPHLTHGEDTELVKRLKRQNYPADKLVVVSPDAGGVERARAFAKRLDTGLAIIDKRRVRANEAQAMSLIGEVDGKHAIMVDDMIDTAGTLIQGMQVLLKSGALSVSAACTHGVFSGSAYERIKGSQLKEVICTDTIPLSREMASLEKIKCLSVAPLLGQAIERIHSCASVSSLFD